MHDLSSAVSTNRILARILPVLPPHTHLVGGCVRDLLLGVEPSDFDLVASCPSMEVASRIRDAVGGTAFFIDRERGVARVAIERGDILIDVSPLRGGDLEQDLSLRDITINAMACPPDARRLIDPLDGIQDISSGIIRLISEKNLLDDPLRGLRCLRFAVQLGFEVEQHTMELVRRHAGTLSRVAAERIKQEVFKAVSTDRCLEFFSLLRLSGHDREVFAVAEGGAEAALEAYRRAERFMREAPEHLPGITDAFPEELERGMTRGAALRLAAYLAPGTDDPSGARLDRLAPSARLRRTIRDAVAGARAVACMSALPAPAPRDMHRILAEHEGCVPEVLVLAMALADGDRPGATASSVARACMALWGYYRDCYLPQRAHPLLTGSDIACALGVEPGPRIGELLRQVEEARAEGLIETTGQALAYLRRQYESVTVA